MNKIRIMNVKEYFGLLMDREGRYSVIRLINNIEDQPVRITKSENCIDVEEVIVEEYCCFTPYAADKILHFLARQTEVDDMIIVYDTEKNLAEMIAQAIENVYGLAKNETFHGNIVFRYIRMKSYELDNSPIKLLSPMDYCKMIIRFTARQIEELKKGILEFGYGCSDFFENRQCDICLKNGTRINWNLETDFDEIIIPNPDEIEYVKFYYCVPEIASPGSFADHYGYASYCVYGLYDYYDGKMEFDSINGIIKPMQLPEKYRKYTEIEP